MFVHVIFYTLLILLILFLVFTRNSTTTPTQKFPIECRDSPIHGRGIFAIRDIKKGDIVETFPVILFDRTDINEKSVIRDYDIIYRGSKNAIMFGYGSIYNHMDDNNSEWYYINERTMQITAIKDIKKDEEIFVSYGPNYWGRREGKKDV